jgi:hypothetical protein
MELVKQNAVLIGVAAVAAACVLALFWMALKRPKVYRRLFVWVILLPQVVAMGFAIWNEGLRQARGLVLARARVPERDTIIQLIDGKMMPEWMILAVPFAVLCLALLLYVLHDLLREDDRRSVTAGGG